MDFDFGGVDGSAGGVVDGEVYRAGADGAVDDGDGFGVGGRGRLGKSWNGEGESEEDPVDWDDVVMSIAAEMVREVRKEVEDTLGYTCSAGIARNKMLAKLAAGWKKPDQQVCFTASSRLSMCGRADVDCRPC